MTLQTQVGGPSGGAILTKEGLDTSAAQLHLLEEYVSSVLREGQDYGIIPGTNDKPTLLKPGAANVIAAFNCYPDPHIETETFDLDKGLIFYRVRVDVLRMDNGLRRSVGQGSCSSYEKKYRYRNALAECPGCHKENIRISRNGGFYCWQKTGGCGAGFPHDDTRITAQTIGQVVNDDPMEQANTILKMAVKRAEVDAALRLPGVARFFTQDLDDMHDDETQAVEPGSTATRIPTQKTKPKESSSGFCEGHKVKLGKHPTEGMVHKLKNGSWCHGISTEAPPPAKAGAPPRSIDEGPDATSKTRLGEEAPEFPDTPLGALQRDVFEAQMEWAEFEADVLHMPWLEWVKLNGTVDTARSRWRRLQEQEPATTPRE